MNRIEFDIYPNMDESYVGSLLCTVVDSVKEDDCNVIAIGNTASASTEDIVDIIRLLIQMDKFHEYKVAVHFRNIDDCIDCNFR